MAGAAAWSHRAESNKNNGARVFMEIGVNPAPAIAAGQAASARTTPRPVEPNLPASHTPPRRTSVRAPIYEPAPPYRGAFGETAPPLQGCNLAALRRTCALVANLDA